MVGAQPKSTAAGVSVETFVARFPTLWHMAEAGSWSSIRERGLLSTTALLDLFEVSGARREALESARRATSETITHPEHGTAVIRDNIPLLEKVLARTLVGMTPREWYETLNGQVFFWVSKGRLEKLRKAAAYGSRQHDILTIDTAALLASHLEDVTLSPMNSGATHPGATYTRGVGTFQPLQTYPWETRVRANKKEPVVELAVRYSVPDIAELVTQVETR
jgi:hypothetical protein